MIIYVRGVKILKSREVITMCVFDDLRKENNYFKDYYDNDKIENIAEEVRKMFGLMDSPTEIATILSEVGFEIFSKKLPNEISGRIGISESFKKYIIIRKLCR